MRLSNFLRLSYFILLSSVYSSITLLFYLVIINFFYISTLFRVVHHTFDDKTIVLLTNIYLSFNHSL